MKEIAKNSIVLMGEVERLRSMLDRFDTEEPVVIACLGGSITEGSKINEKFSDLTAAWLCARFGYQLFSHSPNGSSMHGKPGDRSQKKSMRVVNYGVAGCDFLWGRFQLEDAASYRPEVVLIEYSVNDRKDNFHRVMLESMIRKILSWEWNAQPVLLVLESEVGYSCRGHMRFLSEAYQIPMIDCGAAFTNEVARGKFTWNQFSVDGLHPNRWGHQFISECLSHYFKEALDQLIRKGDKRKASEEEPLVITPVFGDDYEKINRLPGVYLTTDDNNTWDTEFHGTKLLFAHEKSNEKTAATMILMVDNEFYQEICTYDPNAWHNPCVIELGPFAHGGKHTLQVSLLQTLPVGEARIYAIGELSS